jgi:hypothetical protein
LCREGESDNQYIFELESDHSGYYSTETETESEPECEFVEGMDIKGRWEIVILSVMTSIAVDPPPKMLYIRVSRTQ